MQTFECKKSFSESEINSLVRQFCTKSLTLIRQPNFRLQFFLCAMFDKQSCNADDERKTYCELTDDRSVNFKRLQLTALEELHEVDTES